MIQHALLAAGAVAPRGWLAVARRDTGTTDPRNAIVDRLQVTHLLIMKRLPNETPEPVGAIVSSFISTEGKVGAGSRQRLLIERIH